MGAFSDKQLFYENYQACKFFCNCNLYTLCTLLYATRTMGAVRIDKYNKKIAFA